MRFALSALLLSCLILTGCDSKGDKFVKPTDVVVIQKNEFQTGGGLGGIKAAPTTPAK